MLLFQILLRLLKIQSSGFALSEAMGRSETHANVGESLDGLHTPTSKWLPGGVGECPAPGCLGHMGVASPGNTVLGLGRVSDLKKQKK